MRLLYKRIERKSPLPPFKKRGVGMRENIIYGGIK